MADGLEVLGIGEISWTFVACDHTKVQIVTDGFYVPQGEARLLCLSAHSTRKKVFQGFSSIDGLPAIEFPCNFASVLPIVKVIPGKCRPSANFSLLTTDNNLSMGQKTEDSS